MEEVEEEFAAFQLVRLQVGGGIVHHLHGRLLALEHAFGNALVLALAALVQFLHLAGGGVQSLQELGRLGYLLGELHGGAGLDAVAFDKVLHLGGQGEHTEQQRELGLAEEVLEVLHVLAGIQQVAHLVGHIHFVHHVVEVVLDDGQHEAALGVAGVHAHGHAVQVHIVERGQGGEGLVAFQLVQCRKPRIAGLQVELVADLVGDKRHQDAVHGDGARVFIDAVLARLDGAGVGALDNAVQRHPFNAFLLLAHGSGAKVGNGIGTAK